MNGTPIIYIHVFYKSVCITSLYGSLPTGPKPKYHILSQRGLGIGMATYVNTNLHLPSLTLALPEAQNVC